LSNARLRPGVSLWSTPHAFSDLGLKAEIQRAVAEQGYDTPTPIQQQAIPAVLAGHDLMATAQTGTGKTAGSLPILHRLVSGPNDRLTRVARKPRVLFLTPTREAIQVEKSRAYGKHLPINSLAVFGGVGINPQIANLRRGVDILVATPGRLLDHVQQRTVDLSRHRDFRPRRSRPHARHGLHPRHPQDHRCCPSSART
jgi:ATP-dependent RNA helicase RhlE